MIFCRSRLDTDVLNEIGDAENIFLLGCPSCANVSLYVDKAAEDSAMWTITPTGYKAICMLDEVKRLTDFFTTEKRYVSTWVRKYPMGGLCMLTRKLREKIHQKCQNADLIITALLRGKYKEYWNYPKRKESY